MRNLSPPPAKKDQSYSVGELVQSLPEQYQPIFGYPEFDGGAARACDERLHRISGAIALLASNQQSPLRVLDLGCAQGFFSLNLAAMGCIVLGVDGHAANIALCSALQAKNPALNVSFKQEDIRSTVAGILTNEFDLVLGLSVFHHICHDEGVESVRNLMQTLKDRIGTGLFEFASHLEPAYWATSQPDDPYHFISSFPFSTTISTHETHLSPIRRPLFFCSARWWLLGDDLSPISSWSNNPHPLAREVYGGTRRYYFSNNKIAKMFRFVGSMSDHNRNELSRECSILSTPPAGLFQLPALINYSIGETEGWVIRQKLEGILLSELMTGAADYDPDSVISQVLDQLENLESAGRFHNDVRPWNVLMTQNGARLIDFGAIVNTRSDCDWPHDVFLNFLLFSHDVIHRAVSDIRPQRALNLMPQHFPDRYRDWVWYLWRTPVSEWCFSAWRIAFSNLDRKDSVPVLHAQHQWMYATERYVAKLGAIANERSTRLEEAISSQRLELTELRDRLAKYDRWFFRILWPLRVALRLGHRIRLLLRRIQE